MADYCSKNPLTSSEYMDWSQKLMGVYMEYGTNSFMNEFDDLLKDLY